MPSIIELKGAEQTFTTANSFSSANSTQVEGWNLVRIVNISNTTASVNVNYSNTVANCTILAGGEFFLEKPANTTITASSANLLGVSVAFKNE